MPRGVQPRPSVTRLLRNRGTVTVGSTVRRRRLRETGTDEGVAKQPPSCARAAIGSTCVAPRRHTGSGSGSLNLTDETNDVRLGVDTKARHAGRTVAQAGQEETLTLERRSDWTAAVLHRLKAGRKHVPFGVRLAENAPDVRTLSDEEIRGERTSALHPRIAVQAVLDEHGLFPRFHVVCWMLVIDSTTFLGIGYTFGTSGLRHRKTSQSAPEKQTLRSLRHERENERTKDDTT